MGHQQWLSTSVSVPKEEVNVRQAKPNSPPISRPTTRQTVHNERKRTVEAYNQDHNYDVVFIPTPTQAYRSHRKYEKAISQPGTPVVQDPMPVSETPKVPPWLRWGSRAVTWKQDPSTTETGFQKVFLPGRIMAGPRDTRIQVLGMHPVTPNAMGDFVQTPNTDSFDAVHTFVAVRQTLTMIERSVHPKAIPWYWNGASNTEPISVHPHAGDTMNAYYSRSEKALKFYSFKSPTNPTIVNTCRSFDIVSHETGHAILDGLKPAWLSWNNPPQTAALHESFGDLVAIFLTLSQSDQVEAIVVQTKANLHNKSFLADLAEQSGLALGRPYGLRNADNHLKLSQVSSEVHDLSQVFTGAIYDILADMFAFERNPAQRDEAAVLHQVAQYLCSLVIRAMMAAPDTAATFADVANAMLKIAHADGKPIEYCNFIRNQFVMREVVVSPTPLTQNYKAGVVLKPGIQDHPDAIQTRDACCGTMQLHEYDDVEYELEEEISQFKIALTDYEKAAAQGKSVSKQH